jgi:hypothetical protein
LGGIVLGRYVLTDLVGKKVFDTAWAAWGGWIIGSTLAFLVDNVWSIAVGLIGGFVIWWSISHFLGKTRNKIEPVSKSI